MPENLVELLQKAEKWITTDISENDKTQLQKWLHEKNYVAIESCFAAELDFGTAGMRGIVGPGPNRMNAAMVVKTSYGMLRYLQEKYQDRKIRIILGHDARNNSREFAQFCAEVFLAAEVELYFFEHYAPTPLVAFGLRHFQADAAVVITASHNPPLYNGFKAYDKNGAQILSPADTIIKKHLQSATDPSRIPRQSFFINGQINEKVKKVDFLSDIYIEKIRQLKPSKWELPAEEFSIAYTPLHGVGGDIVTKLFHEAGFSKFYPVVSQFSPDGGFPTVHFPNPEEPQALEQLLNLALGRQVDLAIANDPDADRLAIIAPVNYDKKKYRILSGDEIGIILAHALIAEETQVQNCLLVNTVVSSSMMEKLAQLMGCQYQATLTGFKWIANKAIEMEQMHGYKSILGYEEALGYTAYNLVRDKDGISAAFLFAMLAAQLQTQKKTVIDYLNDIFIKIGVYVAKQKSITLEGTTGAAKIEKIMNAAYDYASSDFGGYEIISKANLKSGEIYHFTEGTKEPTNLPLANVVIYNLAGGHRVTFRPSGTEPKLKIYFETRQDIQSKTEILAAKQNCEEKIMLLQKFCDERFLQ